jgi:hypothetical protein
MEKSFIVESKIFAFLVLDGAPLLRVGERDSFSSQIIISSQRAEWLASMLEILLGIPKDLEFIKFFRKISKVLIALGGWNQVGCFLEASTFDLGGRNGFIVIPYCRGGWRWLKFSCELRKAQIFSMPKWVAGLAPLLRWLRKMVRKKRYGPVWLLCGGSKVWFGLCNEEGAHRGGLSVQGEGFAGVAMCS